jgi:predicted xylose isomerase-like sugar epimerase
MARQQQQPLMPFEIAERPQRREMVVEVVTRLAHVLLDDEPQKGADPLGFPNDALRSIRSRCSRTKDAGGMRVIEVISRL